jgi:hypothetical protein
MRQRRRSDRYRVVVEEAVKGMPYELVQLRLMIDLLSLPTISLRSQDLKKDTQLVKKAALKRGPSSAFLSLCSPQRASQSRI